MEEKEFRKLIFKLEKSMNNLEEKTYLDEIQNVRNKLVKLLNSGTVDIPYKLDFSEDMIRRILFDRNITDVGEYYTLLKEFDDIKGKIDFSNVSFDKVLLEGNYGKFTDFSGAFGVKINPQTICGKNLEFVVLDGVEFVGEGDIFKDVDLYNTKITNCNGARINPQTIKDKNLGAKLDGVEFCGEGDIFEDVYLNWTTIKNCKGARINPQTIRNKDLSRSKLEGVEFYGEGDIFRDVILSCFNCTVLGVEISNCKGVRINPQTIKDKSLSNAVLKGVEFIDDNYFSKNINKYFGIDKFAGVNLEDVEICNCSGAEINPQTIENRNLKGSKLDGVEFFGEGDIFKDVDMHLAKITGCKGARINPQTIRDKDLVLSEFEGAEFVGEGDIFKDVNLYGIEISNCKSVRINPQTIKDKSLGSAKLDGVEFIDENYFSGNINDSFDIDKFWDVNLQRVKIYNCSGARINPQTIRDKNLSGAVLSKVEFVGEGDIFKGVALCPSFYTDGTVISDCKGAKINPQTVGYKSLRYTELEGVEFVGEGDIFKDVNLQYATILNCIGLRINPQTIDYKSLREVKLGNVEFIGSFWGVDTEKAEFINCIEKPSIFINFDMFKKFFNRNKDDVKALVKKDK